MDINDSLAVTLAVIMLIAVIGGVVSLVRAGTGLGWPLLRYFMLVIALPLAGILALRDATLTAGALAIAGAAVGYVFGKRDGREA